MNREDVLKLMRSRKKENEWSNNCDIIIKEFNGFPDFWYNSIIISGLLKEVRITNGW